MTRLCNVCAQVSQIYHVRLEYGCHTGDVPQWRLEASLTLLGVSVVRVLTHVNDETMIRAASEIAAEIRGQFPHVFKGLHDKACV